MSLINNYKKKIESKFPEPNLRELTKNPAPAAFIKKQNEVNTKSTLMVGEGVTITGNIKANNEVTIQGSVEGDIESNSVLINRTGSVKGKIKTKKMTVEGKAEGEFNIDEILNIKSEGKIDGKVAYGGIQIDEGGKLSGEINHSGLETKEEEFKDWKAL